MMLQKENFLLHKAYANNKKSLRLLKPQEEVSGYHFLYIKVFT